MNETSAMKKDSIAIPARIKLRCGITFDLLTNEIRHSYSHYGERESPYLNEHVSLVEKYRQCSTDACARSHSKMSGDTSGFRKSP